MEWEISDNNICRKHEAREKGTEAGSQGLMTEDPKQAITKAYQGSCKQILYLWFCKEKLYFLGSTGCTQGGSQMTQYLA